MKKSLKRILCSVLSLGMCSVLAVEGMLRLNADKPYGGFVSADASFKDVTGEFDTSALREKYFNDSVLKSEGKATYETRTVMVTLDGAPLADRAGGTKVADFVGTFTGSTAKSEISSEQTAFLQALSKKGISYELDKSYDVLLNAVAIEVNTKHVSTIKKMAGVDSVVITTAYEAPKSATSTGGVVTNETDVYKTGIYDSTGYASYGEGTVVAVLDTGLDYTHPAFQQFQSIAEEIKDEDEFKVAWKKEDVKLAIENKALFAEERSGSLDVADVYMSAKVPFAYDYADDDADVYPSYSNHGTHVAGIIGGYDPSGYTDKDGNHIDEKFLGVVPDAQLMICKVFTDDLDDPDLGGAVSEDIVAALEDCVTMGVDVINMSLGSSCGFTTTDDGDSEGEMLNAVYNRIQEAGISLICAASNDYSAGYGGVYGTNLASNPDAGTVGSPSTYAGALSVASINGQKASYFVANENDANKKTFVFFEEARDIHGNSLEFVEKLLALGSSEFEYVVVDGVGDAPDYTSRVKRLFREKKRLALIKRGDTTFEEKVETAMKMGAAGVIVYNNVAGVIRMNLGEVDNPVPSASISMNAGAAMVQGAVAGVGKITVSTGFEAGPFMSEFSSWGPTPDLKLKPEITAHGGEITSAVPGGYGEQSGTSMATPNMAGFMAIVRSYIKQDLAGLVSQLKAEEIAKLEAEHGKAFADLEPDIQAKASDAVIINRLAMQLTMSTAATVYDQEGLPYSPRKQGAGVAKLGNIVNKTSGSKAYLYTEYMENGEVINDYRPKIELGDDPDKIGEYTLTFKVKNFSTSTALSFTPEWELMTETLSRDGLTVSEQAHMLTDSTAAWKVDGVSISNTDVITVPAGGEREITVTLSLGAEDRNYIETSFENGMYVEGFLKLNSENESVQCDLSLPFLGFYGDWDDAPMLDYSAYEVAANHKDTSILEEDKIQASIWETQPYNIYYNDKYVLPMGGYLYLLPDDAEPMYVDEEHNAVSRYNEYYGEGNTNNYMTTTGIKAVYAGLLRNAKVVKYKLYDEATGEVLIDDYINRVAKAYSGGGSAVPANVKLELYPEEEKLIANGRYRMEFEFFRETPAEGERASEENTYSFAFTVDYEAPVMQDARVRFYNYKDSSDKERQRVYLDVDVYDNHYAQTLLVCYPKTDKDGDVSLQLATEYPTPIRNSVKNGVTTVSVEITDFYEKYGDQLYVQIDDYALNTCLYQINLNQANANMLPEGEDFGLAEGEESVTVDIYGTHKTALVYSEAYKGEGDASNFLWTSANPQIADVKNGEIVGLRAGTTKVFVSNRKGTTKTINVTVNNTVSSTLPKVPSISLGVIQTDTDALQKASGVISVSAGDLIKLKVETDPWFHPMTDLKIEWSSSNEQVASVDKETGEVLTKERGTAIIMATVYQRSGSSWTQTVYSTTSIMQVQDEFSVSNYTLTDYNGLGYSVTDEYSASDEILVIPDDRNIMYIGEEAFKENNNIKKIIIPSSVTEIRARAFINCTKLEEVYFVSTEKQAIADADLTMINEQAFYGCPNLKKIDFSNVKVTTVAADCFGECPNLSEVVDMPSIGTMHHRAFAGTALTSVDISGLHMSGTSVFENCQKLETITTGKFTAIGKYMFRGCTSLRNEVVLHTPKIGEGAFADCVNLSGVKLESPQKTNKPTEKDYVEFDIGAKAFENCGKNLKGSFTFTVGEDETVRSIGARAFAGSTLRSFAVLNVEVLGENAFANTNLTEITLSDSMDIGALRLTGVPFDGLTVNVAENSQKYTKRNGVIYATYTKNQASVKKLIYVDPALTSVTIDEDTDEIGAYAFAGSQIPSVRIPERVAVLGVGAFKNSKLTEIDLESAVNLKAIPERAFEGSLLLSIDLPDSITEIGAFAFARSALKDYRGGNKVLSIGDGAFEDCITLQTIALADVAGRSEEELLTMGDYVFAGCLSLTEVTLPSVDELGEYTFYGAEKLNRVTFGSNAKTTGKYTFAGTPVAYVDFGDVLTTVGEGAFYECTKLKTIELPATVQTVEGYAFYNCTALASVINLGEVVTVGDAAFYNSALTALHLDKAQTIGDMAFAAFEEIGAEKKTTAAYTVLTLPSAVSIGEFAFYNGGISSVILPASLESVGAAAFASTDKLAAFEVDGANRFFFAREGVLYRKTQTESAEEEYELVSYPTAKLGEGRKGSRSYTVIDGTVRVLAYAFYNLNEGALNAVVLPYTLNMIGDSAFFISGIYEYTFKSIAAPTLEASYRAEVREVIKEQSTITEYKGYYNTNFQTYLYHFTKYGGQTSPFTMHYPSNGRGYDNPVYKMYFGTRISSENDLIEDDTRLLLKLVEKLPATSTVREMLSWSASDAQKKAQVEALSTEMKTVRGYYNEAVKKAGQKPFVTADVEQKLLAVEEELRAVKAHFNIPVFVDRLEVTEGSTYKSEYEVGETFDMAGLLVTVVYDDYSTEPADASKLKLLTTGGLKTYNTYVEVQYEGNVVLVPVVVTDPTVVPPSGADSATDEVEESAEINWKPILIGVGAFAVVALVILLIVKGASARKNAEPKTKKAKATKTRKTKTTRAQREEAAARAKEIAAFRAKYGDVRSNVYGVVRTDSEEDKAHVERAMNEFTQSLVGAPKGAMSGNNKFIKK